MDDKTIMLWWGVFIGGWIIGIQLFNVIIRSAKASPTTLAFALVFLCGSESTYADQTTQHQCNCSKHAQDIVTLISRHEGATVSRLCEINDNLVDVAQPFFALTVTSTIMLAAILLLMVKNQFKKGALVIAPLLFATSVQAEFVSIDSDNLGHVRAALQNIDVDIDKLEDIRIHLHDIHNMSGSIDSRLDEIVDLDTVARQDRALIRTYLSEIKQSASLSNSNEAGMITTLGSLEDYFINYQKPRIKNIADYLYVLRQNSNASIVNEATMVTKLDEITQAINSGGGGGTISTTAMEEYLNQIELNLEHMKTQNDLLYQEVDLLTALSDSNRRANILSEVHNEAALEKLQGVIDAIAAGNLANEQPGTFNPTGPDQDLPTLDEAPTINSSGEGALFNQTREGYATGPLPIVPDTTQAVVVDDDTQPFVFSFTLPFSHFNAVLPNNPVGDWVIEADFTWFDSYREQLHTLCIVTLTFFSALKVANEFSYA